MKYLENVATLALDPSKCTGCGTCLMVCPHGVFKLNNGAAEIVDRDLCMECGACSLNCSFGALSVSKGVGCAAAIIYAMIYGGEPRCDCSGGDSKQSSCC